MPKQPGSTLLPPVDVPPTGFDPDGEDDVPSARIWRIYNPTAGMTGQGHWIPDAHPTKADADAWLRSHRELLPQGRVGAWTADPDTLTALSVDRAA